MPSEKKRRFQGLQFDIDSLKIGILEKGCLIVKVKGCLAFSFVEWVRLKLPKKYSLGSKLWVAKLKKFSHWKRADNETKSVSGFRLKETQALPRIEMASMAFLLLKSLKWKRNPLKRLANTAKKWPLSVLDPFFSFSRIRFVCEESYCQNGMFVPDQCRKRRHGSTNQCGIMLAGHPGE